MDFARQINFCDFIFEPDFGNPVNADNMCPFVFFNLLHHSVNIRAQETRYFVTFFVCFLKLCTSITIPISFWNSFDEGSSIASLMDACQTIFANYYFIIFLIIFLKTNIAYDLVILLVLIDANLFHWVLGIEIILELNFD